MPFHRYDDTTLPCRGRARRIYQGLKRNGFKVHGMWYNANCWGTNHALGWGQWTVDIERHDVSRYEWFCWLVNDRIALVNPAQVADVRFLDQEASDATAAS